MPYVQRSWIREKPDSFFRRWKWHLPARFQRSSNREEKVSSQTLINHPLALTPLFMSLSALLIVIAHVAIFGPSKGGNEGTTAQAFQVLIAGQTPLVAYFAVKYLPRSPGQALGVITLQIIATLPAFAAVYWLS